MKLFAIALDYDGTIAHGERAFEARHRGRIGSDTIPDLVDAIRARYDLRDDDLLSAS